MTISAANDEVDVDARCPGCGETNPAHCHCGDIDDYIHGSCTHVFRGVDDHDECDLCGARRYYDARGRPGFPGFGPIDDIENL